MRQAESRAELKKTATSFASKERSRNVWTPSHVSSAQQTEPGWRKGSNLLALLGRGIRGDKDPHTPLQTPSSNPTLCTLVLVVQLYSAPHAGNQSLSSHAQPSGHPTATQNPPSQTTVCVC